MNWRWIKPVLPTAKFYRAGFTNDEFMAWGSLYTQPASTNRVIDLTNGTNGIVTFSEGNLSAAFTNYVTLSTGNKVVNTSSNKLTFKVVLPSGAFNGNVTEAGTTRSVPFKGVLLQNQNVGCGYFLGTNQSGRVFLGPE
jgi:hypothetical protein